MIASAEDLLEQIHTALQELKFLSQSIAEEREPVDYSVTVLDGRKWPVDLKNRKHLFYLSSLNLTITAPLGSQTVTFTIPAGVWFNIGLPTATELDSSTGLTNPLIIRARATDEVIP